MAHKRIETCCECHETFEFYSDACYNCKSEEITAEYVCDECMTANRCPDYAGNAHSCWDKRE